MATSQDTEITLGTGRVLGLFFGLVVLCAIFFGMGFSLGKNSAKAENDDSPVTPAPVAKGVRRSSAGSPSSDSAQAGNVTSSKAASGNDANPVAAASSGSGNSAESGSTQAASDAKNSGDTNAAPALNGYYVQVAAVSKQEDADALVDALKSKQYSAVATQTASDKLFHVQVGPFSAIKDAEAVRAQLLSDGYNPILKK
jgi:cell division septation protein DedD